MKKRALTLFLIATLVVMMFALVACSGGNICTDHRWEAFEVIDGNIQTEKCANCGVTRRLCYPFPHEYKTFVDNGDGTHSATCGKCGLYTIDNHSFDGVAESVHDMVVCDDCGAKCYVSPYHPFVDADSDDTCDTCGEVVDTCPHSYDEGTVTTPATCTTDGVMTYACTLCGDTYTDVIPATDHSYPNGWTDNADGTHIKVCANDNTHIEIEAHTYSSPWEIAEEGGYCVRPCDGNCGDVETHVCDPDVNDVDGDLVCDFCGFYICDVIGHIDTDEFHDYRCDRELADGTKCGLSTCENHQIGPAGPGVHIYGTNTNGHYCANCRDLVATSECHAQTIYIKPTCTTYGYFGTYCGLDTDFVLLDANPEHYIEPLGHSDYNDMDGYCDYCNVSMSSFENCQHNFEYGNLSYFTEQPVRLFNERNVTGIEGVAEFHWLKCTNCGLIKDFEQHSYDTVKTVLPCDTYEGYDVTACVCGKELYESKTNFVPPTFAGHFDENKDDYCDRCGVWLEHKCVDEDMDYRCDDCEATIPHNHIDADSDSYCDCCNQYTNHTCFDDDRDEYCDDCWNNYVHECTDTDFDCVCDYYGCTYHVDVDGNHVCDNCQYEHSFSSNYCEHYHYVLCDDCNVMISCDEHNFSKIEHRNTCEGASTTAECSCGATRWTDYLWKNHIDNDGDNRCDRILGNGEACGCSLCYTTDELGTHFDRTCVDENGDYLCDKCNLSVCDFLYGDHEYEYDFDENQHWRYCLNCGEIDEWSYEEHYLQKSDTDYNGDHLIVLYYETCQCGYGHMTSDHIPEISCGCTLDYEEVDANDDNICDYCGNCLKSDLVFVETVAPTCGKDGYDLYRCQTCGMNVELNFVYRSNRHDFQYDRTETSEWSDCETQDIYRCTICGEEKERAWHTAHDYDDGKVQYPTCNEYFIEFTCKVCGYTDREHLKQGDGHLLEVVATYPATCSEYGYTLYACQNADCEQTYKVIDSSQKPCGHQIQLAGHFDSTCTQCPYDTYACTVDACGFGYTVYHEEGFEWKDHEMVFEKHVEPTCEYMGYDLYTCENCTYYREEFTDDSFGHLIADDAEPIRVVEAGYKQNGYTVYLCERCGEEYHTNFVWGDHSDCDADHYKSDPSCYYNGYEEGYCYDCEQGFEITIPAYNGHIDEDNDCTCDRCYEEYHNKYAVEHEPTCTDYGYTEFYCTNCGIHVETMEGEPNYGHSHEDGAVPVRIVDPTSCRQEERGYSVYICTVCGEEYEDDFTYAPHVYRYWHDSEFNEPNQHYVECDICFSGHTEDHMDEDCDCKCDRCGEPTHTHADNCQHTPSDPILCKEFLIIHHQCANCEDGYDEVDYSVRGSEHTGQTYCVDSGDGASHKIYCDGCHLLFDEVDHIDADENSRCDQCDGLICSHDSTHYVDCGDGESHNLRCDNCGYVLATEYHIDDDGDETCDICYANMYSSACNHDSYYYADNGDGETHDVYCDYCDELLGTDYHNDYDDGYCDYCYGHVNDPVECSHNTVYYSYVDESSHDIVCYQCGDLVAINNHTDDDNDSCCDECYGTL